MVKSLLPHKKLGLGTLKKWWKSNIQNDDDLNLLQN